MPVNFEPEKKNAIGNVPYFEDITGDAGFRGYSTGKSEDQLMANITAALGRLNGAIIGVRKGKWTDPEDPRHRARFIYEFTFSMPGPGNSGSVLGCIQVAAFPLRKWTDKKDLQARKMALYVLLDMLENTFNFQRITPRETATLIPFMLNKNGVTISEAYITGTINPGLLLTDKAKAHKDDENTDYIDGEVKP